MKLTRLSGLVAVALAAAGSLAYAAGIFPGFPNQGTITGNESIPADTGLAQGLAPQTVLLQSGSILPRINALIGGDFGQNLWQRGTTFTAITPASATMTADGWYAIELSGGALQTMTVAKQTASADMPPGSLASMRIQRVAAQTAVQPMCVGQLVPDDSSGSLVGTASGGARTVVFAVDVLAGANFSPNTNNVTFTIAYHTAADTTAAANGQGTNTATFATSIGATQNITNYIEAVNSVQSVTTTWTRYTTSAIIPQNATGTATQVQGVGVKICFTPVGTAGTNDWIEIGNAQLEGRVGQATSPSPFERRPLAFDWELQQARYYTILENGAAGTPIYANGYFPAASLADVMVQFPGFMRITPVVSPITAGGFKFMTLGTATTPGSITTAGTGSVTKNTAGIVGVGVGGAVAGTGTMLVGSGAGTGVLGFSAEP